MKTPGLTLVAPLLLVLATAQESGRTLVDILFPGTIRVRVVNDEGQPVANAHVALRSIQTEDEPPQPGVVKLSHRWRKKARTDAEGTALLEGLPQATYRIAAGAPPDWTYGFSEATEPGEEVTVALAPLPRERALTGVVLQPDGKPKPGAYLRFVWDDRGRQRYVYGSTDTEGRFLLLADEPGRIGALHVSVYELAFRSTAVDPIRAGTHDIELRLGEPRFLTLEVRGSDGGILDNASATFYWELAGQVFRDYPGPKRERGRLWWERPSVPFYVDVRANDHAARRVGPLKPEEVGEKLVVHLETYPRLRGVVTHAGEPVAGASVSLSQPGKKWYPRTVTDEAGRFDMALRSAGIYELSAWSREHGEGVLGPIELDPALQNDGLEIEITRAPGSITGMVVVPPDRDPREIWLTTTRGHGYMRLTPDGSFVLPDLPAGRLSVLILQGYDLGEFRPPLSTSGTSRPAGAWFSISHGPSRAPEWLTAPSTYEVEVVSGATVELVLDLAAPPPCRLEGRILLDGAPPPYQPREREMYWDSGPRVTLYRLDSSTHVSRVRLLADGTFVVHANDPGAYRLSVAVPTSAGHELLFTDRVELVEGVVSWVLDLPTGSVSILPMENDGVVLSFAGALRRRGPGDLTIFARHGKPDDATRVVSYAVVPAGRVELVRSEESEAEVLLEAEIVAGETTTVRSPWLDGER